MPIIVPSSDLRNKYQEISKLAKESKQPIYITVNGSSDGVFLTNDAYDQLVFELGLYKGILEGERDIAEGKISTHEEVFSKLKKEFSALKK